MFRHRVNLQITHTVEWCFWPGAVLLDKRNVVCYHEVPEGAIYMSEQFVNSDTQKNIMNVLVNTQNDLYICMHKPYSVLQDLHQFFFMIMSILLGIIHIK